MKSIATIFENFLPRDQFEELKQSCLIYADKKEDTNPEIGHNAIIAEDWVGPKATREYEKNHPLRSTTYSIKKEMLARGLIGKNTGYEYWLNINKQQEYHYDCDEGLRQKHGIFRFPVVSSVFYISCPNQQEKSKGCLVLHKATKNKQTIHNFYTNKADELSSETQRISPRENRLVFFPPRVPHKVEPWSRGERISMAVNFWEHRPLEKNYTDLQLLRTLLRMQLN